MFGIGGLTGIPLAFNAIDLYLHDTYYVIAPLPLRGRAGHDLRDLRRRLSLVPEGHRAQMNELLGRLHFWGSLVFINGLFFPMFLQGMAGVHRRWYDGGATYELSSRAVRFAGPSLHGTPFMSYSAFLLGLVQLLFIFNFFWSMFAGRKVGRNPWECTTLEWDAPPRPARQLRQGDPVFRGPYEYSVPGADKDFTPQTEVPHARQKPIARARSRCSPATSSTKLPCKFLTKSHARPDTGLYNAKLGIWLFLASEVMLFGGLFSAYIFLRLGADDGYWPQACSTCPWAR